MPAYPSAGATARPYASASFLQWCVGFSREGESRGGCIWTTSCSRPGARDASVGLSGSARDCLNEQGSLWV